MRDVCLLRGHNKEITTLTWHPIHANLMTTAGQDGSIYHYLLDEPHTPPGTITTIPPYDAPDQASAPAQTIWPAHRVENAHSLAVWSLAWHPLGHILTSGGNDRCTRFWTRARPGEGDEVLKDAFHLGEQAAEAQGTYSRAGARALAREQEERELQDEAEGLIDQTMPGGVAGGMSLPGLPGLGDSRPPGLGMNTGTNGIPDGNIAPNRLTALQAQGLLPPELMGAVPPPPIPGHGGPNPFMNMPPEIMQMMQEGKLPPPPTGMGGVPPPPPGFTGFPAGFPPPPPGFQLPQGPNGVPPPLPGFMPEGLPPLPGMPGFDANGHNDGADAGGVRKRTPLPSQQDGFKAEQKRGNYRVAR